MDGAPAFEAGTFATDEPSLYEAAIRPWELTVDLRHATSFRCDLSYLKLDGITLYRDRYAAPMRLQGVTPPGVLTLGLPVGGLSENSAFWGSTLDARGVYGTFYGELDSTTAAAHDQFIVLIDTESPGACADIVAHFAGRRRDAPLMLPPGAAFALRARCQRLLDAAARLPPGRHPAVAAALRDDLLAALTALLPAGAAAPGPLGSREQSAIAALYAYLAAAPDPAVPVARICRDAGIGERTLERAVRARFDCTVQQLLRRRRFHEARRRLLAAEAGEATVTGVAYDLGFYDGGRFARDYRGLFGEMPSGTLRRGKRDAVEGVLGW